MSILFGCAAVMVIAIYVEWYENHPYLIDSVFYRGQHSGVPSWVSKRTITPFGVSEYPTYPRRIVE